MALDFDNLVIDRPLRLRMQDKSTGELWFVVNELKEATLTNGAEQVFLTGSAGTRIAVLDRNKTTTLTFQSGLVSMSMMATQTGAAEGVQIASTTNKIVTPGFEVLTVGGTATEANTTIELAQTPIAGSVKYIYVMQKDNSLGKKFALNDASGATADSFSINGKVITLPTGADITANTRIAVDYQYETDSAIKVVNRSDEFAKKGTVILEVLLRDICDNNRKYYAQLIVPNGAMSGQFDITMNGDGSVHGATVEAISDYCSVDKELFSWIVPDAA